MQQSLRWRYLGCPEGRQMAECTRSTFRPKAATQSVLAKDCDETIYLDSTGMSRNHQHAAPCAPRRSAARPAGAGAAQHGAEEPPTVAQMCWSARRRCCLNAWCCSLLLITAGTRLSSECAARSPPRGSPDSPRSAVPSAWRG